MNRAEREFKQIVMYLLIKGVYPSPMAIRRASKKQRFNRNLNGRECKWREEVWEPWMNGNRDHPITRKRIALKQYL